MYKYVEIKFKWFIGSSHDTGYQYMYLILKIMRQITSKENFQQKFINKMYFKGGKLKTLEHKDKESLQAEWIDPVHIQNKLLPIR